MSAAAHALDASSASSASSSMLRGTRMATLLAPALLVVAVFFVTPFAILVGFSFGAKTSRLRISCGSSAILCTSGSS
jgi:hypothetical protein